MKESASIFRTFLVVLCAGILVSSCEKDKGPTAEEKLVGTWTSGTSTFNATVNNTPMLQYFAGQGVSQADAQMLTNLFNVTMQQTFSGTITFNSDKTYTSTLGGDTDSGTWSLNNDATELTIDSSNDDPVILQVQTLTEEQLRVKWQETGAEDLNEDTVPEQIAVDVDLTFDKQ
jgi:hypothetical protein